MNPVSLVIGFVPLVLFGFLDGPLAIGPAAVVSALVAVAAVLASQVTDRGVAPVLPLVQAATLVVIAVIALAGTDGTRDFLTNYGQGIASLVLAGYMLITVVPAPFTAAYAKADAPREVWTSPNFINLNRRISLVWGVAILVMGLAHLWSGYLDHTSNGDTHSGLLDWAPSVIAIVVALRYTQRAVSSAKSAANQPAGTPNLH